MPRRSCCSTLMLGIVVVGVIGILQAAPKLGQAIVDAEGFRKAAENGVRQIKAQGPNDGARTKYSAVAEKHNAWLDLVGDCVTKGQAMSPDLQLAASDTASALVEWLAVRNSALGMPELAPNLVPSTKDWIGKTLVAAGTEVWKDSRTSPESRRGKIVTDLNERLRWKHWEEIR